MCQFSTLFATDIPRRGCWRGAKYAAQTRCRSITNKKQPANQLGADHGACQHHERIIGYGEVLMSRYLASPQRQKYNARRGSHQSFRFYTFIVTVMQLTFGPHYAPFFSDSRLRTGILTMYVPNTGQLNDENQHSCTQVHCNKNIADAHCRAHHDRTHIPVNKLPPQPPKHRRIELQNPPPFKKLQAKYSEVDSESAKLAQDGCQMRFKLF